MKNEKIKAQIRAFDLEWEDVRRLLKYSPGKFYAEMNDHEMNSAMRRKVEKIIVRLARDADDKQIDGAFSWNEMYHHKIDENGK